MSKFYISTAIAYPNAAPHMGHALEFSQADCLARYHRLKGDDVLYSTGTDEHGVKIAKTAEEEGITPQDLVDRNVKYFLDICEKLQISYDSFYRTSSESLKKGAQKLWSLLEASGDIYKDKHTGLYCYGCESFKLEKDLLEGKCPNHMREPDKIEEENYFFKLSKYKDELKNKLIGGEIAIYPEFRKTEILNILDELNDLSFSRPKSALPWGVTVPSDEDHVMYVWCDALSNYLTGLGYFEDGENYHKYWPNDLNLIGKDISRFHAIYWPAMLMSANFPLPKVIMIHGFLSSEGKKMSKSLGNVVDPIDLIENYGADAVRYYLLREVPTLDDGDFSYQRFFELYNSDLANSLGNLVNRVISMTHRYLGREISCLAVSSEVENVIRDKTLSYHQCFDQFDLKKGVEQVVALVDFANKYIEDQKPWLLAKEDQDKLKQVLFDLLVLLEHIGLLLLPYMPEKAAQILNILGLSAEDFSFDMEQNQLTTKYSLAELSGQLLFPRIEED